MCCIKACCLFPLSTTIGPIIVNSVQTFRTEQNRLLIIARERVFTSGLLTNLHSYINIVNSDFFLKKEG